MCIYIFTFFQVHQTSVDNVVSLITSVVERTLVEFVTTAKTNFIHETEFSVEVFTITHTAHVISQKTHTTFTTNT